MPLTEAKPETFGFTICDGHVDVEVSADRLFFNFHTGQLLYCPFVLQLDSAVQVEQKAIEHNRRLITIKSNDKKVSDFPVASYEVNFALDQIAKAMKQAFALGHERRCWEMKQ